MRDFPEIQRELNLVKQGVLSNGTSFVVPVRPGAPRVVVRRFDRDPPARLIPAYAGLLRAAGLWIEQDRELAAVARVEPLMEIGSDFIARRQLLGNSLSSYFSEDERVEPPREMALMQSRFRVLAAFAREARESLVVEILTRSVLVPSAGTIFFEREDKFVILDLESKRDDLERWTAIGE